MYGFGQLLGFFFIVIPSMLWQWAKGMFVTPENPKRPRHIGEWNYDDYPPE
jgi:hypothetical protein